MHFRTRMTSFTPPQKLIDYHFLLLFYSGAFYVELNTTIVSAAIKSHEHLSQVTSPPANAVANNRTERSSARRASISGDFLLSASHIAYICNGELGAFCVAWNLIMEFIVIVALISKALIMYIDAAIYGNVGHLTQIVPMVWPLSQYVDVLALLVPIVIGGKLAVFANRNKKIEMTKFAFSACMFIIPWVRIRHVAISAVDDFAATKYHFECHIHRIEFIRCGAFPIYRHI